MNKRKYPISMDYGSYTVDQNDLIVQLYNSSLDRDLKRVYLSKNRKALIEKYIRRSDLRLKRSDDHKLLVLDGDAEITLDENHNLIKRTSRLFTLEGYFRHNVDSAVFYEVNTQQRWKVSKYGAYQQAIREYHMLVRDKFDAIYLKGVGFTINHVNEEGHQMEALVFKQILQTSFKSD